MTTSAEKSSTILSSSLMSTVSSSSDAEDNDRSCQGWKIALVSCVAVLSVTILVAGGVACATTPATQNAEKKAAKKAMKQRSSEESGESAYSCEHFQSAAGSGDADSTQDKRPLIPSSPSSPSSPTAEDVPTSDVTTQSGQSGAGREGLIRGGGAGLIRGSRGGASDELFELSDEESTIVSDRRMDSDSHRRSTSRRGKHLCDEFEWSHVPAFVLFLILFSILSYGVFLREEVRSGNLKHEDLSSVQEAFVMIAFVFLILGGGL